MVSGSPWVLIQLTLVPTSTVKTLGLNSLSGIVTNTSLVPCTAVGAAGAGVAGAGGAGVAGAGVAGAGMDGSGVAGAGAAGAGVVGAGLAQALRISNTPPSKVTIMDIFRILNLLSPS